MALYEYVGPNDHYLDGGEHKLTPGDEVELEEVSEHFEHYFEEIDADAGETGSSDEEDESPSDSEAPESDGAESAENGNEGDGEGDESPDAPLDIQNLSVSELEVELDAGDHSDEELDALEQAERGDDEPRTTALDAIESAR